MKSWVGESIPLTRAKCLSPLSRKLLALGGIAEESRLMARSLFMFMFISAIAHRLWSPPTDQRYH
jgi:hypothetical protein